LTVRGTAAQFEGQERFHPDTAGGTGPNGYYAPADLRSAYNIPSFGGVVPQTIALFEDVEFNISVIQTLARISLETIVSFSI
jgi:hypothetical protein